MAVLAEHISQLLYICLTSTEKLNKFELNRVKSNKIESIRTISSQFKTNQDYSN